MAFDLRLSVFCLHVTSGLTLRHTCNLQACVSWQTVRAPVCSVEMSAHSSSSHSSIFFFPPGAKFLLPTEPEPSFLLMAFFPLFSSLCQPWFLFLFKVLVSKTIYVSGCYGRTSLSLPSWWCAAGCPWPQCQWSMSPLCYEGSCRAELATANLLLSSLSSTC